MFWVQEVRPNGKHEYYAESELDDIPLLPTNEHDGLQTNGDTVSNQTCSLGAECLCLDTANLYLLTTSGWIILGG